MLLTDQKVPAVDPRNGSLRVAVDHVGSFRTIESNAVLVDSRRLYETVGHGCSGAMGVQEPADATAPHYRRQPQILLEQASPGRTLNQFNTILGITWLFRVQVRTLEQLARLKEEDKRAVLHHLSDDQYNNVVRVLGAMPYVEMNIKYEVVDDEATTQFTAGAIVTVH